MDKWRFATWFGQYKKRPWGVQGLLPDTVLTSLASKARLNNVDDLVRAGWSPTMAEKHGAELLTILGVFDTRFQLGREAAKRERAEQKKRETAARREEKREAERAERAQLREEHAREPKKPRLSRAKQPEAFGVSSAHNTPFATALTVQSNGQENLPPNWTAPQPTRWVAQPPHSVAPSLHSRFRAATSRPCDHLTMAPHLPEHIPHPYTSFAPAAPPPGTVILDVYGRRYVLDPYGRAMPLDLSSHQS